VCHWQTSVVNKNNQLNHDENMQTCSIHPCSFVVMGGFATMLVGVYREQVQDYKNFLRVGGLFGHILVA
jgi:hypothetical protein